MKPTKEIPIYMLNAFSMDGQVDIEYKYRDDSGYGVQEKINSQYNPERFSKLFSKAQKRRSHYYGKTDQWLYWALDDFSIRDKDVLILGSASPWYEAIAILYGAKSVDVLEHSPRPNVHPKVRYCNRDDLDVYDVVFSISSFEHYGLGRYGDMVDPLGDIFGMKDAKKFLKDDGLLFLSVPIGKDKLIFNVHRIYGKLRFPVLISDFNIVKHYGVNEKSFDRTDNNAKGTPYQPVFVLKKK